MKNRINILLQTTIPATEDDWNIGRFSLVREHLESLTDEDGDALYNVTARNIEKNANGDDEVLSRLDATDFDEIWLFGVDTGDGLTTGDCEGITKFRQRGGGIYSTRDHQDLGSSLCTIGGVGAAHYFHSKQQDPNQDHNARDDQDTKTIDFPNYHSGSNGDYQTLAPLAPVHALLKQADGSPVEYFPSHPHEGGIGKPAKDDSARVIATGTSQVSGNAFNLIVAFEESADEHGNRLGRAVAESSFHHLVDYNWDTDKGCPTFLTEPPGDGFKRNPKALDDVKTYVANVARWLAPQQAI